MGLNALGIYGLNLGSRELPAGLLLPKRKNRLLKRKHNEQ